MIRRSDILSDEKLWALPNKNTVILDQSSNKSGPFSTEIHDPALLITTDTWLSENDSLEDFQNYHSFESVPRQTNEKAGGVGFHTPADLRYSIISLSQRYMLWLKLPSQMIAEEITYRKYEITYRNMVEITYRK